MSQALYNAASGALVYARSVDVTAGNIANANTTAYRERRATFQEVLAGESASVTLSDVAQSNTPGALQKTGNPLHVAIQGEGFFVMEGPSDGYLLTRDGSFTLDRDGRMVDSSGRAVLARDGGEIVIPPGAGKVSVGVDGQVSANGEALAVLQVVNAPREHMVQQGQAFFLSKNVQAFDVESPQLQSGTLEGANFSVVNQMVELVRASRAYEAATKTIQTLSEIEKRTARDIGSAG